MSILVKTISTPLLPISTLMLCNRILNNTKCIENNLRHFILVVVVTVIVNVIVAVAVDAPTSLSTLDL